MQDNSVLILYPPIKTDNILVTCISNFQMQYYLVYIINVKSIIAAITDEQLLLSYKLDPCTSLTSKQLT